MNDGIIMFVTAAPRHRPTICISPLNTNLYTDIKSRELIPAIFMCVSLYIIPANILRGFALDGEVICAVLQHYHGGLAEAVVV